MAHLEITGKRVSKTTVAILKGEDLTIGLWGPMNTFVKPARELDVVADPSRGVKLERSKSPIDHDVRKWRLTALETAKVRIEARAGSEVWDAFELDVQPKSYKFLTGPKRRFIEEMARAGRQKAKEFGYPLSAMVACACGESGFGTSPIYRRTGSPFNLQKPPDWKYPKCETVTRDTVNVPNQAARPAPFCKAVSLADAARLWCEWIAHHPSEAARNQLLRLRHDPKAFASSLFLVNFANSSRAATAEFGRVWEQFELGRFDKGQ